MRLKQTIGEFVYSENNPDGVLMPKSREFAEKLINTLGTKQRKTFVELLKSLPKVRVFAELGDETARKEMGEAPEGVDDYSFKLNERTEQILEKERSKKFKEMDDVEARKAAALQAEDELAKEGVEPPIGE